MTDTARVAVIIPCFRDGPLAAEAVASIQEEEPVEVVVVDDSSTDDATLEALERLESDGVTVVRHERNLGPSQARLSGMRASTAPYVFPLDADDHAVPGALARMADRLEANPEADVCFGDYVEFGESEVLRAVPTEIDPYRLAYTNEYPVSSMFRRRLLEDVGGWPTMLGYEDWHLWMTLAERGVVAVHVGPGVPTYMRRLHGHRLLTASRTLHPQLYAQLRNDHPRLFGDLAAHRERSQLSRTRKVLYPIVYGSRRRHGWERRVKSMLDRAGVWTLRR